MSVTQLGSGMTPAQAAAIDFGPLATLVQSMRAEMMNEMCAQMAALEAKVETLARQPAPVTHVAPAAVTVKPADVTVNVPETEPPEAVDLTPLADQIKGLRADMRELIVELRKPTVRTVSRNSQGTIERITESR